MTLGVRGPAWWAARVAISMLVVAVLAGAVFAGPRLLNRVRGASSPEDVATSYVTAARSGDALRIRWLMPTDQEDLLPIAERIELYRAVDGQALEVAYEPHSVAAYLVTVRIKGAGITDEIRLQAMGTRWYLIQLP